MTTATAARRTPDPATHLQRLYAVRFTFAIVWAGALLTTASHLGAPAVGLLVVYPLFDLVAAVVDARTTPDARTPALLYTNVVVSGVTTIGVALACASGIPAVLRLWGAWAVVAGIIQLLVGVARRRIGGQWPMIASGGISVLAGGSFIVAASADDPKLTNLAGYAVLGGIFFLVSALRLGRSARKL